MRLFSKNNEFPILFIVSSLILICILIIGYLVGRYIDILVGIVIIFIGIILLFFLNLLLRKLIKEANVVYLKSSLLTIEKTHSQQLKTAAEELNLAQMRLIAHEKLAFLGSLTAGVAHEIKNPLNFIINFSELSLDIASNLENEFKIIVKNPAELEGIINNIQTLKENILSIIEQGKRSDDIVKHMLKHAMGEVREFEAVNVKDLLEECCALSYSTFYEENKSFKINFESKYDPEVRDWLIVPGDMSRVFINIFSNAYDALLTRFEELNKEESFTPTIWIQTRKLPYSLEITIGNNGIGIAEEIKNKIFTPFFSTKPPGNGIGLGLSLSRTIIVEEHRGEIYYESHKNKTEFIMTIPANLRKTT